MPSTLLKDNLFLTQNFNLYFVSDSNFSIAVSHQSASPDTNNLTTEIHILKVGSISSFSDISHAVILYFAVFLILELDQNIFLNP